MTEQASNGLHAQKLGCDSWDMVINMPLNRREGWDNVEMSLKIEVHLQLRAPILAALAKIFRHSKFTLLRLTSSCNVTRAILAVLANIFCHSKFTFLRLSYFRNVTSKQGTSPLVKSFGA